MPNSRKATITDEHRAEAAALSAIWDKKKTMSQAAFALKYGIGSQGAVGNFLAGTSALSLKAAKGFATGLQCDISDFSPRLAKELLPPLLEPIAALRVLADLVRPLPDIKREQVEPLFRRLALHPEQINDIAQAFAELLKINPSPIHIPSHSVTGLTGQFDNEGMRNDGTNFQLPDAGKKR
ncbi:hypothetical protein [Variovorax sp. UMC13]|uniref:hypothetical protein n=1 Tax=Variovorax sp. UMC13 TaxID=1862326 RepID=UPI001602AF2D|nr:hypothetical protein [Variovorax sp. UMC13]